MHVQVMHAICCLQKVCTKAQLVTAMFPPHVSQALSLSICFLIVTYLDLLFAIKDDSRGAGCRDLVVKAQRRVEAHSGCQGWWDIFPLSCSQGSRTKN